ncbi:PIN domain-containing protein, partial [Bacteroides intestinalis]|uniref:hypothetical protein n=1 Tax=Bacteroides intestinalis TaxID=329854 RepID=UPI001EE0F47E
MIVAVMALPRPVVGCARPISGGAGWFDTIEPTAPLMSRATEIALSMNHPAYDCFYLATAELHD